MEIGAYRSSPVPCIHNPNDIPPLDKRRLKLALNYELKQCRTLATQNSKPFIQILPKFLLEYNLNIYHSICSLTPPWEDHISTFTELT